MLGTPGVVRNVTMFLPLLALAHSLYAQEQPLSVQGTVSTGFYSTTTRGEANQSLNFVPIGARFEITGFYKSADFLNFSAEPELNLGPQASEAGFQGGNGIRFRSTFLRRLIPLTFRYSNIQVEDVYFGGLSQVSGYSLKNRNKDLGVTLELKFRKLPSVTIDWGTSSTNSKSGIAEIPDYNSHGNHVNVDGQYQAAGWIFDAFLHRQEQQSNILEATTGGTQFGSLFQNVTQYQGSARRGFLGDSELYVNAGTQSTSSLLFSLPIDLSTHYASANLRLFQKRRVRTSLRAGYSSNIASQYLAQAISSLTATGAALTDQTALQPFSRGMSSFNLNATTYATLPAGFGAFAGLEHNEILSSAQEGPLSASYFSASAGLTYAHKVSWGNFSGEYSREYGIGSITGQSGTIQGQTYRLSVQEGANGGLQFDASVHGNGQSVQNAQPLSNRSVAADGSVANRLTGSFRARVGGGWQWGSFLTAGNDFRSGGYTAHAGIEHPRFQLNASINNVASDSLPLYNPLLVGLGTEALLAGSLRIVPSDYRATSVGLHANPLRKVELSASWTRSRQHLDQTVSNAFEMLNAMVTYHFRKIKIEAGLIRFDQSYAFYQGTVRTRFYIRFVRNVRVL